MSGLTPPLVLRLRWLSAFCYRLQRRHQPAAGSPTPGTHRLAETLGSARSRPPHSRYSRSSTRQNQRAYTSRLSRSTPAQLSLLVKNLSVHSVQMLLTLFLSACYSSFNCGFRRKRWIAGSSRLTQAALTTLLQHPTHPGRWSPLGFRLPFIFLALAATWRLGSCPMAPIFSKLFQNLTKRL
jgi:hypothetical protein